MKRAFAEDYAALQGWPWWFRGRRRILGEVLRRELGDRRTSTTTPRSCGAPLAPTREPPRGGAPRRYSARRRRSFVRRVR